MSLASCLPGLMTTGLGMVAWRLKSFRFMVPMGLSVAILPLGVTPIDVVEESLRPAFRSMALVLMAVALVTLMFDLKRIWGPRAFRPWQIRAEETAYGALWQYYQRRKRFAAKRDKVVSISEGEDENVR